MKKPNFLNISHHEVVNSSIRFAFLRICILFYVLLLFSCEKVFFDEPQNKPKEVFNFLWQNFDKHYPAFIIKNVNWDSVYSDYEPIINNNMSDDELFAVLSNVLSSLKDEHAWLSNGEKMFSYYNKGFNYYYIPEVVRKYLSKKNEKYMFIYGKLTDSIGYFHISTFYASVSGYEFIDDILKEFKSCKGIVIDVRNNAGGSSRNAQLIASRFYDKKREYCYDVFRNGLKHNEFSQKYYSEVEPSKNANSKVKLILITDRSVGSSGEDFTMMMRVLPQLTVIGDTTHGNPGGTPNAKELPNGWLIYMPTSLEYTIKNELVYKGLPPDITVTQQRFGHDLMIEKAVELLR
jgi:hypothetical protein